eukprot:7471583-Pyramimonas_sp.AAC.1
MASKTAQMAPRCLQDGSKRPKRPPRAPQDASKRSSRRAPVCGVEVQGYRTPDPLVERGRDRWISFPPARS